MFVVVAGLILSGASRESRAATLTNSFKAPLTTPYVECNEETSTSDCTSGSMELDSPWTFSAGTIEIDEDEVSLRLDDLQLRSGLTCAADVGSSAACACWNNNSGTCSDSGGCNSPDECGPAGNTGADNNYFIVSIYLQDYFQYGGGAAKIRRDINCHPTVNFDLVNTGTNKNRQVNQTVAVSIDSCGVNSEAHGVEIRHIEINDKYGNRVARVSH